jgi:hypothetical protein
MVMSETRITKAACKAIAKAINDPSNHRGKIGPRMSIRMPIEPNPAMMAAYEKLIANGGRVHIDIGKATGERAFAEFLREQGMPIIDDARVVLRGQDMHIVDASVERGDGIET